MYVFYEDDGSFKAGNILSETDASLQLSLIHISPPRDTGRRVYKKSLKID